MKIDVDLKNNEIRPKDWIAAQEKAAYTLGYVCGMIGKGETLEEVKRYLTAQGYL